MKKRFTRILAMVLCVLSIVALLPTAALAADDVDQVKEAAAAVANELKLASKEAARPNATKTIRAKVGQSVKLNVGNEWYYGGKRVAVKYQWYIKKPGGSWKKIKGATKYYYKFKATMAKNKYKYRCKITMKSNSKVYVYSDTAYLKVSR